MLSKDPFIEGFRVLRRSRVLEVALGALLIVLSVPWIELFNMLLTPELEIIFYYYMEAVWRKGKLIVY
jgi:hypothetical protein